MEIAADIVRRNVFYCFLSEDELPLATRRCVDVCGGAYPLIHGDVGEGFAQDAIMDCPRP